MLEVTGRTQLLQPNYRYIPNGSIGMSVRLACAIRYFAGGSPYDLMTTYQIRYSVVMRSVWFVVHAINCHSDLAIQYPKAPAEQQKIVMKIPQGFEKFYPKGWLLLLKKTIYGLKQAAFAFWKALLKAFKAMNFDLYYAWTKHGLVTWISWVDNCLVCGSPEGVKIAEAKMMSQFDCDEIGNMDEYVGCKIDRDIKKQTLRFTQPVMIQSFMDEFDIPEGKNH